MKDNQKLKKINIRYFYLNHQLVWITVDVSMCSRFWQMCWYYFCWMHNESMYRLQGTIISGYMPKECCPWKKKRENPGFLFLEGQGKLAHFFGVFCFVFLFLVNLYFRGMNSHPHWQSNLCTVISRLKSSRRARQVWGNCSPLIRQM